MLKLTLKWMGRLQNREGRLEIIVIDNNSTDNTKVVVNRFISNNPHLRCYYKFESKMGPSYARNSGIASAHYPYVIFIDDDVIVPSNVLNQYKEILKKHPDVAIIGGKTTAISKNKTTLEYYLKQLENDAWVFSHSTRSGSKLKILEYPDDLVSANILVNRHVLHGKLFNENFGRLYGKLLLFSEDTELCLRVLLNQKKIIYDPAIRSKHNISSEKLNYSFILRRFFRAGCEHQLLDEALAKFNIRMYKFSPKFLLTTIYSYIKRPNIKNGLKIARELLFFVGYYFPLTKDL